jgi:hypothetical protein
MTLTACKKCNKIFTADALSCPYCGAVIVPEVAGSLNAGDFRKAVMGFFLMGLLTVLLVFSSFKKQDASAEVRPLPTCQAMACPGGTAAITLPVRQELYYTCKSGPLSDYANYVLDLMREQVAFAGLSPRLSAETGEPEVSPKAQLRLDQYRKRAGVTSFEGALALCYRGIDNLKVIVLLNPAEGDSIYVSADEGNKFWLPRTRLGKL